MEETSIGQFSRPPEIYYVRFNKMGEMCYKILPKIRELSPVSVLRCCVVIGELDRKVGVSARLQNTPCSRGSSLV